MSLLIIKSQSEGWINLVNRFSKKNSVVWITGNRIDKNSVCINHKEALLCKPKNIKLQKHIKLTKEDFDLLNKNFTFLNDLLNRNLINIDQINYFSKREFIINSFKFWKNFLINYPIKRVISRRAPHRFYDLIIYLICTHYKIKILFIDNTTEIFPCKNRLIVANYFSNNLNKRTDNFFNKKKKNFLAREYLKIISKKKNGF